MEEYGVTAVGVLPNIILQDNGTLLWEQAKAMNISRREMLIKVFPRVKVSTIKIFSRDSQEGAYYLTARKAKEMLFFVS